MENLSISISTPTQSVWSYDFGSVEEYAIEEAHDPPQATCRRIQVSREWMNRIAQDRVAGKSLHVPPEFVGLLKILL